MAGKTRGKPAASKAPQEELAGLIKALGERHGVPVSLTHIDMANLAARVESHAAIRLLVAKGIVSEAEVDEACTRELTDVLGHVLFAMDEQKAQRARGPKVVTLH